MNSVKAANLLWLKYRGCHFSEKKVKRKKIAFDSDLASPPKRTV